MILKFPARRARLAGAMLATALAAFVPLGVHAVEGNADAAVDKISMCTGCHAIPGYKTAYPRVYSVPKIAGQTAQYIQNALVAYQKGDRSHPSMRAIAGSLSEQDMADIAAFYAGR